MYASPVDWARANRVVGYDESPFPGTYECEPYLVQPQESATHLDPCELLVWLAGSQCGKTMSLQNVFGHMVTQNPGPALWVIPNEKEVDATRVNKIEPFVANTPALAGRMGKNESSRKARDNAVVLSYAGGVLRLGGSRGRATYRQDSAALVVLDDADAFSSHPEGDHLELAKSRIRAYRGRGGKVVVCSKPTLSTTSITLAAYKASSQAVYEVPCLHCGAFFVLWREYFRFEDESRRPYFECPHCSRAIYERAKTEMVRNGKWHHRRPERALHSKGYHFWAAYTPTRYRRWDDMAAALRKANARQAEGEQKTKQTVLGEDWAIAWVPESETRLDDNEKRIYYRREQPFKGRISPASFATVAATDVQHNRIETAIWKFGYKLEGWLWDVIVTQGAPELESTWLRWKEILVEERVQSACVDSKYRMETVLDSITEHMPALLMAGCAVYATVGIETTGPLWPGAIDPGNPKYGRVQPVSIRVNTGKEWLYGVLETVVSPGPGFLHFDTKVTRRLLRQLFSERPVVQPGRKTRYEPRPGRSRNELLDLTVMAKAALDARCAWDVQMEAAIYGLQPHTFDFSDEGEEDDGPASPAGVF